MRWKLVLLLGLLATGTVAAALVRAQEASLRSGTFGGAGGLRTRPTPAAPIEGAGAFRASSRSGGLAERLQQVRQSVVEDYNAEGAEPGLIQPAPDAGEAPSAESGAFRPASSEGLPSVLKRSTTSSDAPPSIRTAAMDAAPASPIGRPTNSAAASPQLGPSTPPGARPLGSPPPSAAPQAAPAVESLPTQDALPAAQPTLTPIAPPSLEESGYEAASSRRRASSAGEAVESPAVVDTAPRTAMAPAETASPSIDPSRFRAVSPGQETILIGAAPQLRVEAVGPKSVVRGQPASYTVVVSNVGEAAARNVEVHLQSRQTVEISVGQATHGGAEVSRSTAGGAGLLWSISELPRGAKAELEATVVSHHTAPFDLTASWSCAPLSAAASIEVLEPQLAMTLSGPKDVLFGETKIYTITLTNPGTGDAENVMLALAPLSSDQSAPPPRNMGTLRAGERKEIPIQLTAREAGLLAIRAQASADGGLRAEAAEQVLVRRAQLQLAIEGPPLKYAGASAEYQLRVSNTGNAPVDDVVVAAALPAGVEYVAGDDGGATQSGGVAWRVGSLAPGDERTITFHCALSGEGEKRIMAQTRGAGDLQATAQTATTVEALADLKLIVNDPPGPIAVGKEVTYEVRVLNRGTKAASGVEVAAYFSEGIEPISAEGLAAQLGAGQVIAAPIPALAAGAELVLKIKAKASQPGNHIFRAVVQCATPETRLAMEETTRFFGNTQPTPAAPPVSQQPSVFQPIGR